MLHPQGTCYVYYCMKRRVQKGEMWHTPSRARCMRCWRLRSSSVVVSCHDPHCPSLPAGSTTCAVPTQIWRGISSQWIGRF